MTLFWHNHFATGYTKIAGVLGAPEATRYMAAKPSEDPARVRGQIEMLRDNALGNFRDMLIAIAMDTAMLVWLDGRTNTKAKPQENFGREVMELFTMGVGHYTEADVYAAARVFTGWNLRRLGDQAAGYYEFAYNAGQHDTNAKTFSFPIYPDGGRTIPGRSAAEGMQDGRDLATALAGSPDTARYLATKLYRFFVSEFGSVSGAFVDRIANIYLHNGFEMKPVLRAVLLSPEFWDSGSYFSRYAWPVEFVVRAIKEIGWRGFSVNDALPAMANMGQTLYDPPDVAGWDPGAPWFSTGAMLARMNFAAVLTSNQRINISQDARGKGPTPEALLTMYLDRLSPADYDRGAYQDLLDYLRAGGTWTGNDAQIGIKAPGLLHLIVGSSEYQFV